VTHPIMRNQNTAEVLDDFDDGTHPKWRMEQAFEINSNPNDRKALEARYGKVWNTDELGKDFEVFGFLAPFVAVTERATGKTGSLTFQHEPRFYYDFTAS